MEMVSKLLEPGDCGKEGLLAIKDTMVLLSGKWKIQLIGCLMMYGTMRFMDLRRRVEGIAAKVRLFQRKQCIKGSGTAY